MLLTAHHVRFGQLLSTLLNVKGKCLFRDVKRIVRLFQINVSGPLGLIQHIVSVLFLNVNLSTNTVISFIYRLSQKT